MPKYKNQIKFPKDMLEAAKREDWSEETLLARAAMHTGFTAIADDDVELPEFSECIWDGDLAREGRAMEARMRKENAA